MNSIFFEPQVEPENKNLFREETKKLSEITEQEFFRIPGTGTYEQAKDGANEDHGTFFMTIPSIPKSPDKVTVVSFDGQGKRGAPQVLPGILPVIPHKFKIQIDPAKRVKIETVPE